MIVEAHFAVRRGIRDALADTRYQVVAEASAGRSAIDLLNTVHPDIAIVDHMQPKIGIDCIGELKTILPSAEVLIYSSEMGDEAIAQLVRVGARAYVCKADSLRDLIVALDALSIRNMYFSKVVNNAMLRRIFAGKKYPRPGLLTQREVEVVQLIAKGRSSSEIARKLGICMKTIESHRRNARDKINCRNTADIVRFAVRNGLVQA